MSGKHDKFRDRRVTAWFDEHENAEKLYAFGRMVFILLLLKLFWQLNTVLRDFILDLNFYLTSTFILHMVIHQVYIQASHAELYAMSLYLFMVCETENNVRCAHHSLCYLTWQLAHTLSNT